MRHRFLIQRPVKIDDEFGGTTTTWQTVEPSPVPGKRTNNLRYTAEAIASGQTISPMFVQIDIRARALDHAWRLVGVGGDHDGLIYNIVSLGTDNKNTVTTVFCKAGANDG